MKKEVDNIKNVWYIVKVAMRKAPKKDKIFGKSYC